MVLALVPSTWVLRASAADASLVVEAIRILQGNYVEPVQSVPLLNAAIATLRKTTSLGPDALPDIAPDATESDAAAAFTTEFSRAVQTGTVPATQLAYLATEGMLKSLHDSNTHFLTPGQIGELRTPLPGIGTRISQRKDASGIGWIFVDHVFSGSPAADAGIHRFDKIVQVDGKSLQDVDALNAIQLIRGPAGSTANLVIQRNGQTLQISVVRVAIREAPVEEQWLRPGVAYVQLFRFSSGAGREMRSALEKLSTEGTIRSVVLDLRGNSGGLLAEAASVGGIFLPERTVLAVLARVNERGHVPSVVQAAGVPLLPHIPLVVLVDGESAEASEIVTAALKDFQRGTVVGEKTAGNLGAATTISLSEGAMSVRVARIMGPKNEQVDGVGINPDLPVTLTLTDMEKGQDTQLEAALHALAP